MEKNNNFNEIVTHLQDVGFVFQGSQIYGGLSNSWDYGPLGSELKNNLKNYWWQKFVHESPTNVGVDASILMNPNVWKATGHVSTFNDPLIDCMHCHSRYRADQLVEEQFPNIDVNSMNNEQLNNFIKENKLVCPSCNKSEFTDIRKFNMMFKTHIGVLEDNSSEVYLRPETAQGCFVNFKNVQRSMRLKLPFGIANIGKSFRNEITPGNFIFRTREFDQMELEFFCKPNTDLEWFKYWKNFCIDFVKSLEIKEDKLRFRDHTPEELAFYSKATTDIEYLFPFGWGEVWGIADRTDYDLKQHQDYTKEDLTYFDPETNNRYLPYCIEPSLGLDRLFLMVVCNAYENQILDNNDSRKVMHIPAFLAPYKVSVLPLSKQLNEQAIEVYKLLSKQFNTNYDVTGSIGKRYRRNDSIGTPYCITYDFESLEDQSVTVRDRDTMKQERVKIENLIDYLKGKIY
ncbi:MAG: glycine--tRNA ligase [Bacillales bacterium]